MWTWSSPRWGNCWSWKNSSILSTWHRNYWTRWSGSTSNSCKIFMPINIPSGSSSWKRSSMCFPDPKLYAFLRKIAQTTNETWGTRSEGWWGWASMRRWKWRNWPNRPKRRYSRTISSTWRRIGGLPKIQTKTSWDRRNVTWRLRCRWRSWKKSNTICARWKMRWTWRDRTARRKRRRSLTWYRNKTMLSMKDWPRGKRN